jgi:MinD-like ATPase involved in chromosome partitioning or flagellar assembly
MASAAEPSVAAAPSASNPSIDELAQTLRQADARRVAVIGAERNVGTTLTAIALARSLVGAGRVVLVDLALASPNIDVISREPGAPGIADLVRGASSFGDIITRDQYSRVHVVAAGRIEGEPDALLASEMLPAAIDALAQSYDYVVIDGGSFSDTLPLLVPMAPRAVLVGGDGAADALQALSDRLRSQGFADVTTLTGPPPQLYHAPPHSAAA